MLLEAWFSMATKLDSHELDNRNGRIQILILAERLSKEMKKESDEVEEST